MSWDVTARNRAALLITALAVGVAITLVPFLSGLLGAAVLYVAFKRPYQAIARRTGSALAAVAALCVAITLVLLPLAWVITVVLDQAPSAVAGIQGSRAVARLGALRVGDVALGGALVRGGEALVSWIASQALGMVGTVTAATLNAVVAFFGFYYLLTAGDSTWRTVRSFLPFSESTAEVLRQRFHAVTEAMLAGFVVVALLQGTVVGIGFGVTGLSDPVFWASVTAIASVLPVLGSALVWFPGTIVLLAQDRFGAAAVLALCGLIASNIDNVVRPLVYRRVSDIHPMIALVGAFAGVRFFGLAGLLLGPLSLAYLFELLRLYRLEYGGPQVVQNVHDVHDVQDVMAGV